MLPLNFWTCNDLVNKMYKHSFTSVRSWYYFHFMGTSHTLPLPLCHLTWSLTIISLLTFHYLNTSLFFVTSFHLALHLFLLALLSRIFILDNLSYEILWCWHFP